MPSRSKLLLAAGALAVAVAVTGFTVWRSTRPAVFDPTQGYARPGTYTEEAAPASGAEALTAASLNADHVNIIRQSYLQAFGRQPAEGEIEWWAGWLAKDARLRDVDVLVYNHRNWIISNAQERSAAAQRAIKAALGGQTIPSYHFDQLTKPGNLVYVEMVARAVVIESYLQALGRYPTDQELQKYESQRPLPQRLSDVLEKLRPTPPVPIELRLSSPFENMVSVTWTQPDSNNITGFRVQRMTMPGGSWETVKDRQAEGRYETYLFNDYGAKAGPYSFRVCAYNSAGETCTSPRLTDSMPAAPTGFKFTSSTSSSLSGEFVQVGAAPTSMKVFVKDGPNWKELNVWSALSDGARFTFTESGLSPGQVRTYKACALNQRGQVCTPEVMAATNLNIQPSPPPAPAVSAPAGLTVTHSSAVVLQVSWASDPANQVEVHISASANGENWEQKGTLPPGAGSYEINVSDYTSDYYKVILCALSSDGRRACGDPLVVGKQWDHPSNFTTLDYGMYWVRCSMCRAGDNQMDAVKAVPGQMNANYYNPWWPTVVYVHGWQHNTVATRFRESLVSVHEIQDTSFKDLVDPWKDQGPWNVGIFYWNQFADDDWPPPLNKPYFAESKIWENGKLTWRKYTGNNASQQMAIQHQGSAGDLFYESFLAAMEGYQGNHVRIVGHSLGSQMAVRLARLLSDNNVAANLIPKRVAILDPAIADGKYIPNMVNSITHLQNERKMIVEQYESSVASALANGGALMGDSTTYSQVPPLFEGDKGGKSHAAAVHWYFSSMRKQLPAYWTSNKGIDWKNQAAFAPTAAMSDADVWALRDCKCWFKLESGAYSPDVSDDMFARWWD